MCLNSSLQPHTAAPQQHTTGRYRSRRGMPARQRGLGLMAAIFVITIMAVIVAGLSSLVVTSKESFGYEIMSVRAFLMAESGAQLAINHIFTEAQGTATVCSGIEALPASFGQRFPGCEFEQVSCPLVTIDNADYFTLTSRASCGSGTDQAIRSLTLRVQR